jgi:hypothetical protein
MLLTEGQCNFVKKEVKNEIEKNIEKLVTIDIFRLKNNKRNGHFLFKTMEEYAIHLCTKIAPDLFIRNPTNKEGMGDLFLIDLTPVNVKFGFAVQFKSSLGYKYGKPNGVSMNKLLDELFNIDAYYFLKIKLFVPNNAKSICDLNVVVDFFNLYDYLKYVEYDAGHGQIMLNEAKFYKRKLEPKMYRSKNEIRDYLRKLKCKKIISLCEKRFTKQIACYDLQRTQQKYVNSLKELALNAINELLNALEESNARKKKAS